MKRPALSPKLTATVFRALCAAKGLPDPVPEYRFSPPRRWRFDWAFVAHRVALEVEGGVWVRGRHTRGSGYVKDMEKYSEAAAQGWRIVRVEPVKLCAGTTLELLRRAIAA